MAAFIRGRRSFEGGVYYYGPALRARNALIRSREIDEHGCSRQPELGHSRARSWPVPVIRLLTFII